MSIREWVTLLTFQFSTVEYLISSCNLLKFFRQLSIMVLGVSCEQCGPRARTDAGQIRSGFGIDLDLHYLVSRAR